MNQSNWLTLAASAVALLSVITSFWIGRRQLQNTTLLAVKQIEATGRETSKKLRADIIAREKQAWIKEFRDTVNEILFLGDSDLDENNQYPVAKRVELLIRLCHKVDLMLPFGEEHAHLTVANAKMVSLLQRDGPDKERLELAGEITRMARRILIAKQDDIEADL